VCVVYFTRVTSAGIRVNGVADGTGFLYPYTRTQGSKPNRNTSFFNRRIQTGGILRRFVTNTSKKKRNVQKCWRLIV